MKILVVLSLLVFSFGKALSQTEKLVEPPPPPEQIKEEVELKPPPPLSDHADDPFVYVEQMPHFKGGQDSMYIYLNECLGRDTTTNSKEGQVILQFVVAADGTIIKPRVMRSPDPVLSESALRCVTSMPNWIPGRHNNKNVPVTFTLPVKFIKE